MTLPADTNSLIVKYMTLETLAKIASINPICRQEFLSLNRINYLIDVRDIISLAEQYDINDELIDRYRRFLAESIDVFVVEYNYRYGDDLFMYQSHEDYVFGHLDKMDKIHILDVYLHVIKMFSYRKINRAIDFVHIIPEFLDMNFKKECIIDRDDDIYYYNLYDLIKFLYKNNINNTKSEEFYNLLAGQVKKKELLAELLDKNN